MLDLSEIENSNKAYITIEEVARMLAKSNPESGDFEYFKKFVKGIILEAIHTGDEEAKFWRAFLE